ncbi:MAG TPA: hypothetical protein VK524_21320 [Polyangiaceae bacterium]|nr:hypothetical protein [Polyangiaceae bacterium]
MTAAVAVERAKALGTKLIKQNLTARFCTELTEKSFEGTSLKSVFGLAVSDARLFPATCSLLQTTNVEVLAAVPKMLARALTGDLSALLMRALSSEASLLPKDVRQLLIPAVHSAVLAAIEGRAMLTERDSQLLLLKTAQIGFSDAANQRQSKTYLLRLAIEAGLTLVAECVQEGRCSADDLASRIQREMQASLNPDLKAAFAEWDELVPVLARAMDVFQPPTGAGPRATAKVALNFVMDLFSLMVRARGDDLLKETAWVRETLRTLDATLNALCKSHGEPTERTNQLCRRVGCSQHRQNLCSWASVEAKQDSKKAQEMLRGLIMEWACTDDYWATQLTTFIGPDLCSWKSASTVDIATDQFRVAVAALNNAKPNTPEMLKHLVLLREIVNAVSDEEPERAARAAGAFLGDAIADAVARKCGEGESCITVTSAQVRKAFSTLNAVLAYAASYRPRSNTESDDDQELEKLRLQERKKAMNDLIDAATDRADRGGHTVVSIGVGVGGGYSWSRWDRQDGAADAGCEKNPCKSKGVALTLPVGFALDVLPERFFKGPLFLFGFHGQLSLVDLGQYAATAEGETVKPEAGTALMPRISAGLSLGNPDVHVIIGGGFGYAPLARFDEQDKRGIARADISVSVYVPFVDFN